MPSHRKIVDEDKRYSRTSYLIHGKFWTPKWDFSHHVVPPMSSSSTFRLERARRGAMGFIQYASELDKKEEIFVYDRLDEPTKAMLEERLAYVEEGEVAVTFASGMASIAASIGVTTKAGDSILSHKTIYGCTYSLFTNWLPRYNIKVKFIDMKNLALLEKNLTPDVAVVYLETPVNPNLELIDIRAVCDIVKQKYVNRNRRPVVIVDNTFATPFCQRPLKLGADIVVHSLTKDICGFGTELGGAVVASRRYEQALLLYRKDFGGVLSSKNAWSILVYGLPSLELRVKKQQQNALEIARFLQHHPKVERVCYPGLEDFPQRELAMRQMVDFNGDFAPGSMLYFVLKSKNPKDALSKAERFADYIGKYAYCITLAVSLGQIRTLLETPGIMSHSSIPPEKQVKSGIDPGGIRVSVGIESSSDIIRDLKEALEHI